MFKKSDLEEVQSLNLNQFKQPLTIIQFEVTEIETLVRLTFVDLLREEERRATCKDYQVGLQKIAIVHPRPQEKKYFL